MWKAIYTDGGFLNQFEEEKENLFKDVDEQNLTRFEVEVNSKRYWVDLETGTFGVGTEEIKFEIPEDCKLRLIYFRRVKQTMSIGANIASAKEIQQCLGWQATIGDINHQRIMKVTEANKVTFEVK